MTPSRQLLHGRFESEKLALLLGAGDVQLALRTRNDGGCTHGRGGEPPHSAERGMASEDCSHYREAQGRSSVGVKKKMR